MPKNAPWHSAATTRPASITAYVEATAESRLPTMKSTIRPSSTCLRGSRVTPAVRPIAPTATLSA